MPNAVILDDIVRALYESEWKNEPVDETAIAFDKFKETLLALEIYRANPSIENAWVRLTHSVYCAGSVPGVRGRPETKKAIISLETIRIMLYGEIPARSIINTNTQTQTYRPKGGVKE